MVKDDLGVLGTDPKLLLTDDDVDSCYIATSQIFSLLFVELRS